MNILREKWICGEEWERFNSDSSFKIHEKAIWTERKFIAKKKNGEPKKNGRSDRFRVFRTLPAILAEHIVVVHNVWIAENEKERKGVISKVMEREVKSAFGRINETFAMPTEEGKLLKKIFGDNITI